MRPRERLCQEVRGTKSPDENLISGLRGSKPIDGFFQVGDGARFLGDKRFIRNVLALRASPLASSRFRSVLPAFWRHSGHGDRLSLTNESALGETSAEMLTFGTLCP